MQATALSQIAGLLSGGRADADTLARGQLRYSHTQAVRGHLAETFAPATANRMLAALRGVLTEAWRLGQMSVDLADVDLDAASVTVRAGKGGKHRVVFLPAGAVAALHAWRAQRGLAPGPLFCPVRRGGHPAVGRRLDAASVALILTRCADAAGVPRFRAHDLRRTVVGELLDAGADLATVARICGHAQPSTTARYDRRGEQARQHAAGLLHVPFPAPRLEPPAAEAEPGD